MHEPGSVGRARSTDPSRKAATCGHLSRSLQIACKGCDSPLARCGTRVRRLRVRTMPEYSQPPTATAIRSAGASGRTVAENRLVILHPLTPTRFGPATSSPTGKEIILQTGSPESMRDGIGNCPKHASPFVLISARCFVLTAGREPEGSGQSTAVCSGWRNGLFPRCSSSRLSAGYWSDSC